MWKSKRKSQHGTQNVNTHNRTTQKNNEMSNTDPTNKPGVSACAREGYAVPASYKTPVMVFTYSIQGGHVTVASFYDFSMRFWNYSDNLLFFSLLKKNVTHFKLSYIL
jgi:PKD repeat protein